MAKIGVDFEKAAKVANRKPLLPKKGVKLFSAASDWKMNARLNFLYDSGGAYTEGFGLAGKILSKYVRRAKRHQDILIYPIVFLNRHYMELRLKEIIKDGRILLGSKLPEFNRAVLVSHDLEELWKVAKNVLEFHYEREAKEDPEVLLRMEKFILQFHEADGGSFSFRYAKNKKGGRSINGITHINIAQLQVEFSRFSNFLDMAHGGIKDAIAR